MILSSERDVASLRTGLERWIGRPVTSLTRPVPGYSCETLVVDGEFVVRLPPLGEGIFPTYDLKQQTEVQQRVASSGVPVAAPLTYEPDPTFLGTPFVAMHFVDGPIPADFTPADPWLHALPDDHARHTVWDSLLQTMVKIHAVPVEGLRLRTGLEAELRFWEEYVLWATDGTPEAGLSRALRWCRDHAPAHAPTSGLLWGDARFGNVVFDTATRSPKAVLDWDMVSAGPIEMDIAWFLALDQIQRDLSGMAVSGFGSHVDGVTTIEHGLGRTLVDMEWYEIFALVRASAVWTRIAVLSERHGMATMFRVGTDPASEAAAERISRL